TDHAGLALGGPEARRYPVEIGPLSGMPVETETHWAALAELVEPEGVVGLFFRETPCIPEDWTVVRSGELVQMVAEDPKPVAIEEPEGVTLRVLTKEDAGAMVELATLTEPGPFRLRTHELGTFFGIFADGRLVAMAGKRMHVPGYVEVSAVCTHPEARGRGYARLLMSCVMEEIVAAGKTPFLHSLASNAGAIRVYEDLGFRVRRGLAFAAVARSRE
ncbi:MAG TPA: GNAT family N-acetyltransferase, partial [Acidobacteriaceae bacterium]|nr:GNAT family N-acetyltransferase [Acidobacteriaceae bacterium]